MGVVLFTRLAAQRLVGPRFASPVDVVRGLGAVQAQDFAGALWAVAQRLDASHTERDLAAAFDRGEMIRTHVLRPTWHFVAPDDLRGLLSLTGPRIQSANARRDVELGLDASTRTRAERVFARALEGGRHLTRHELAAALRARRIDPSGQRLVYLLMHAELAGLVCSGPRVGRQFTYALADERVGPPRGFDRDATLATLVTRYFTSRGPATLADAAWWSGLTQREVRDGIALSGDRLARLDADGVSRWQAATRPRPPARRGPIVRLLPNYDEFTVAYRDRSALLHPRTPVTMQAQSALLQQPVMVDGRHAGSWRRTVPAGSSRPIVITLRLTESPTPALHRALEAAASAYARFLERDAVVTIA